MPNTQVEELLRLADEYADAKASAARKRKECPGLMSQEDYTIFHGLCVIVREKRIALEAHARALAPRVTAADVEKLEAVAARIESTQAELNSVDRALAQPQWQPIETAPKDGTFVLVFDSDTEVPQLWVVSWLEFDGDPDGGSWVATDLSTIAWPTHWMPLPPAPKG